MLHVILRQGKMSKYQFCVLGHMFATNVKEYYKMIESNSDYERNQAQALKSVSNEDHLCLKSEDKCCEHETQNTTFFTESLHLYGSVYTVLYTY